MSDNLNFDILSDNEGADLLQQFYSTETKTDATDATDDTKTDNKEDNKDTKEETTQTSDDDKPYQMTEQDLVGLLNKDKDDEEGDNKDKSDLSTKTDDKKDTTDNKEDKKTIKAPEGVFGVLYSDFVDRGILDEVEGFDGTEEGFLKAYQESLFKKAEELHNQEIEEIFSANPKNATVGKDFLAFLAKGGDPEDFIELHTQREYKEEDLAKESVQEKVVREFLKLSGVPEDKIDSKIAKHKALESLEEEAKDAFEILNKHKEKQKIELQTQAEQNRESLKQRVETFNNEVIKTVNDSTELFGFHLGKDTKTKRELVDYMFKPTVKTESGQLIPKFAVDRQKVVADPKWVLLQALALKNDLDFSKVIQNAETKVTKSLKEKLESADEIRKNKGENRLDATGNMTNSTKTSSSLEQLLQNTLTR